MASFRLATLMPQHIPCVSTHFQGIVASFRLAPDAWRLALTARGDRCGFAGGTQATPLLGALAAAAAMAEVPGNGGGGGGGADPVAEWQSSSSSAGVAKAPLTASQWLLLVAVAAPTRLAAAAEALLAAPLLGSGALAAATTAVTGTAMSTPSSRTEEADGSSVVTARPEMTPGERFLTALVASPPSSALLVSTLGGVDVLDVIRQAQVSWLVGSVALVGLGWVQFGSIDCSVGCLTLVFCSYRTASSRSLNLNQ